MAVDMFIKIKGIDGESKDDKHKNEIDVLALWDEKNLRYFTGYHNNLFHAGSFQPAIVLIPADGDPVIIVEAMKMQNEMCAAVSGTVASIPVAAGQAVNPGDPLIVIEPEPGG